MLVCDTCRKDLASCACDDRSRSRERKQKEKKDAESSNTKQPVTTVTDLTDLFTRLEARAERREQQTKEDIVKLIEHNDDKWKKNGWRQERIVTHSRRENGHEAKTS